jgi:phosphotransferase system HPr (HPr) family protein
MPETAITRTVVVTDPAGLHARTAVALAEVARRGKAAVTLIKEDRQASATDVLQVLTLVVAQGEKVTLEAVGPDAAAVLDQLEPLFAGNFGDDRP